MALPIFEDIKQPKIGLLDFCFALMVIVTPCWRLKNLQYQA
jgi:hypothetical protein